MTYVEKLLYFQVSGHNIAYKNSDNSLTNIKYMSYFIISPRLHMSEKFSSGTTNPIQTKINFIASQNDV